VVQEAWWALGGKQRWSLSFTSYGIFHSIPPYLSGYIKGWVREDSQIGFLVLPSRHHRCPLRALFRLAWEKRRNQVLILRPWLTVEEGGVEEMDVVNHGCNSSRCNHRVLSSIKVKDHILFHHMEVSCLLTCLHGVLEVLFLHIHLQPLLCNLISGLLHPISRIKSVTLGKGRMQLRFSPRRRAKRLLSLTQVWFLWHS
jgi:hypothetical protein